MKKWFNVIASLILMIALTGCVARYDHGNTARSNISIDEYFFQIPNETNLYYAKDTGIVYWIGGTYTANLVGDDYATSYMTPWYAPNGKPYKYNINTKEIEPLV